MQLFSRFTLGEIVDTNVLQEIQDKFSEATGMGAVIVDVEGNPITNPSNFTSFCNYVRSNSKGLTRCMACDDQNGRRAVENKEAVVYLCHTGLTDLAAPIIVEGQYIGAFLAGQVVQAREDGVAKAEMFRRVGDLSLDKEALSQLFDQVAVVPENRIHAAADLIYIMSNYIVEIGMANIIQKQLMTEMKAKAELESLLKATELKALQSQVNPHFLFNTLNTIARLALLEGANQTQDLVYALADLLRNNLRDMDCLRTVEEEVKSIQDYLTIQKVRFGDRIRAYIHIDQDFMQAKVPALTLQPIVENAVIHGLERKLEGGQIHLLALKEEDKIVIQVMDTGVGIAQERIQSIFREEKRKSTHGQTTGLGVLNVHKRIQYFFGSEYGLSMESVEGTGTVVSVHLPYHTE